MGQNIDQAVILLGEPADEGEMNPPCINISGSHGPMPNVPPNDPNGEV